MRNHWFWFINLALLLLYGWTLTEESAVRVQVAGDECTAVFPESRTVTRTSSIPCPGLRGGSVGLYFSDAGGNNRLDWGPLDWLAPRSGWRTVTFTEMRDGGNRLRIEVDENIPGWQRVWGEWRPVWETAVMRWQTPIYGDYLVEADLRRPSETAGILFLQPNGEDGWAFITNPDGRRGVWWEWGNGRPTHPIVGIPFQKTTLAQVQSLLRRLLRAQQGALLLLMAGWILAKIIGCGSTRINADFSLRSLRFISQPKTIVLLIALGVLAATVYIAGNVLERMPHVQDSITYLFQAEILARGRLWANAPPLPDFFDHQFLLVRNGRWFGQYPPGFPAVLAIGMLMGQPWLINPLLAALTVPLLYWLGKELYGRATGLLTVLLALVSPFFLFMSGSMMAHPAELFWLTLFMASWVHALKSNERRWTLLAGVGLGMVFLTRQVTAVAVGLPFLLVTGVGRLEIRDWRLNKSLISSLQSPIFKKTVWLLATAVPLASLLFLHQYALTGDPLGDPRLLLQPFDRLGFGEDVGSSYNAFTLSEVDDQVAIDWYTDPSQPPRGHTLARGIYNDEQNWRVLEIDLFGWLPTFTLAFVWLAFLRQRPSLNDLALLATIAGTLFVYLFFWADGIMYGPRYFYGILPALFLLTARGIGTAANWISGRAGQFVMAVIVLLLVGGNLLFYFPGQLAAHRGFNFVDGQPRAQIETTVAGKALVFVANDPVNWWEYGRFFSGNTPWLNGRIIYARDLGEEENGRLLPYFPDYTPYRWQDGRLYPFSLGGG
ncbi:MAG: glycosyltransferase family 39 protein [Ardenticatenaceae bacterium]|nr:glycosyltransferase family 39 protein [Ardenticatenaceae bacterium]MCB9444231.1 glycosyltransferase family 39 protein [Ardenticatenaceae bacterium]